MMKISIRVPLRIFGYVTATCCLFACDGPGPNNLSKVTVGMTVQQVLDLLGPPKYRWQAGEQDNYLWDFPEGQRVVVFSNGRALYPPLEMKAPKSGD